MIYNDSFMNNATNIVNLMVGIGESTGNPFLIGYLILFSCFLVFLILTYNYSFHETLIVDSFLTTIISIGLYASGMIPSSVIAFPSILFFLSILFYLFIK